LISDGSCRFTQEERRHGLAQLAFVSLDIERDIFVLYPRQEIGIFFSIHAGEEPFSRTLDLDDLLRHAFKILLQDIPGQRIRQIRGDIDFPGAVFRAQEFDPLDRERIAFGKLVFFFRFLIGQDILGAGLGDRIPVVADHDSEPRIDGRGDHRLVFFHLPGPKVEKRTEFIGDPERFDLFHDRQERFRHGCPIDRRIVIDRYDIRCQLAAPVLRYLLHHYIQCAGIWQAHIIFERKRIFAVEVARRLADLPQVDAERIPYGRPVIPVKAVQDHVDVHRIDDTVMLEVFDGRQAHPEQLLVQATREIVCCVLALEQVFARKPEFGFIHIEEKPLFDDIRRGDLFRRLGVV